MKQTIYVKKINSKQLAKCETLGIKVILTGGDIVEFKKTKQTRGPVYKNTSTKK